MGKVKKVPMMMQMEMVECGAASLGMVLAYHKKWLPLEQCLGLIKFLQFLNVILAEKILEVLR